MKPSIGTETRWPADIDTATSQKAILPASDMVAALEKRYRLALSWHFEPVGGAGGDIWGIQALDDDTLALYAADFAGHGPSAAANTFLLHGLLSELHADGLGVDPAAILGAINEELVGTLATGNFTAMIYGVLSVRSATFAYAAAMMPRPIVAERGGARVHVGDGAGFPLGVSRDAVHENRHLPFPPDSFLLLHSDAMTEGFRPTGGGFMTGVVTLIPEGTGTRYVAVARHADPEATQTHRDMGFLSGWGTALDQMLEMIHAQRG